MIKIDTGPLGRLADDLRKLGKQAEFAGIVARTRTATLIKTKVTEEINRSFDRPTPYTQKSIFVRAATRQKPDAIVGLKDFEMSKNIRSAKEILGHDFLGGSRLLKRFDGRLTRLNILPAASFVAPGRAAQLDPYGNINRGQVTKLLSRFGSLADKGMSDRSFKRLKKQGLLVGRGFGNKRTVLRSEFFVAKAKSGGKPLGIWQLLGRGKVGPVLAFTRTPRYRMRVDFHGIADQVIAENLDAEYSKALGQAIASAGWKGKW